MINPNISSVETCYGILKHFFPSTPYHLPDKVFIPNEAMSNDKIKEAINTSIRKIFSKYIWCIYKLLFKEERKAIKQYILEIKTYIAYILKT